MQSLKTFFRLSGPIQEVKKICIDQCLWKYYCILGKIREKRGVGGQVWFVPDTFGGLRAGATTGKFCRFNSHLSLETVFSEIWHKTFIWLWTIFFLKTGYLILNWVPLPLPPTNIPSLKDYPHDLTNIKSRRLQKSYS